MFSTILAAVDIRQPDKLATTIEAARTLAEACKAKLVLLHVIEQMPSYVTAELPTSLRDKIRDEARKEFEDVTARQKLPAGSQVILREGHVYHEILNVGEEVGADLIVLASHSPVMADYLLGSVAASVVRHARCSVLVLRRDR